MNYIVFDLEFNQDIPNTIMDEKGSQIDKKVFYPFEIIQIGAVKLDSYYHSISTFNRFIRPTIYTRVSPFISELTGITTEQLLAEEIFPDVYMAFLDFIGDTDSVFCTWGMSDIKELFRNTKYHQLDNSCLPSKYINIQPLVSLHFGLSSKKLLSLQTAVELLNIPINQTFHDASSDAYYTSEIFKRLRPSYREAKIYDPDKIVIQAIKPKKTIDVEGLIKQFEKMYNREFSEEEKGIVLLAYKMGKTHQFIKLFPPG
ncbi:3'-5' exonuclease [Anaerocolumna aminovalerica]|uniref:Exonuclease n=1 Tax=Anaerocolumna aminovalerica TaxID=1527 RepID=A0A1I5FGI3_9FIRM|nr:3'-5' exonuclease [Anaerocolumna aminovalerica]SFO22854.1 Exonuclease [Anaerocolumna aminovalerica]